MPAPDQGPRVKKPTRRTDVQARSVPPSAFPADRPQREEIGTSTVTGLYRTGVVPSIMPTFKRAHAGQAKEHMRLPAARGGVPALLLAMLAFTLLSGCKVTSDDIEYWKGTVKGPGKIVAVLSSERYPLELRTQAALALIEMERNDVSGVGELQRALQALQSTNPEVTQQVVDGMVPGLQAMMRGGDSAPGEEGGPPLAQQRAKDAAYILIAYASPASKQQLMSAVVGWYAVDFADRHLSGDYSAEQVVRSLGAPAAGLLVDALNSPQPQRATVKTAQLIGQTGAAATQPRARGSLFAISRETDSGERTQWPA